MAASTLPSATRGILGKKAGSKNCGKSAQSKPPAQPPITKNLQGSSYGTIHCPECGSRRVWRDGRRYVKTETAELPIQRYLCRNCGRRFSETSEPHVKVNVKGQQIKMLNSTPDLLKGRVLRTDFSVKKAFNDLPFAVGEDVGSHDRSQLTNVGNLKYFSSYNSKRRVCVTETKEAKNLAGVESRLEQAKRGATKLSDAEIRGKLVEYSWFMKMNGYKPAAIESYTDRIGRLITKGADLMDPQQVKRTIAGVETWCDGSKKIMCDAYDVFVRMEGLRWKKPKYKYSPKLPFVPTTDEIDAIIAGCGSKRLRIYLQGLKETGADPGELYALEWGEIDFTRKKVSINHPVKDHNPRILNASDKWLRMLSTLPRHGMRVWGMIKYKSLSSNLRYRRKRLAHEYGNSRLNLVKFTSFRHWKGTMEYHKTHDIMHVKELLGHKSLLSTQVYVHLEEKLFQQLQSEYLVRRARSIKGMLALAAVGYEKFDEVGDVHLYRKQKTVED